MAGHYIDISTFNIDPSLVDWAAYKAWSDTVALRSSYGVGEIDNHYRAYLAGARAAGISRVLHYHYAYPQLNSPQAEADWQRQVVTDFGPNDLIMLDYEENTTAATSEWAFEWLNQQQSNFGKQPVIYSYSDYIINHLQDSRLAQFPLIFALWTTGNVPPPPAPWTSIAAWQYTDSLSGVPGFGNALVDGNLDINLGGLDMFSYGPNSPEFGMWFTVDANGNWICPRFNTVIIGGNKAFYSQLSLDGKLPLLGLPLTSELYQHDPDGYSWSVQFFERGILVFDPQFKKDNQGYGATYIGKYEQFISLDPNFKPSQIPANILADIQAVKTAGNQLITDAGL